MLLSLTGGGVKLNSKIMTHVTTTDPSLQNISSCMHIVMLTLLTVDYAGLSQVQYWLPNIHVSENQELCHFGMHRPMNPSQIEIYEFVNMYYLMTDFFLMTWTVSPLVF